MKHISTILKDLQVERLSFRNSRKNIIWRYSSELASYGTERPWVSLKNVPSSDSFLNCFIGNFFERQFYKVS